jgi:hypothetical protein
MVDNALDACEAASVSPVVKILVSPDSITVADNGPGMAPATLERILDYGFKTSSNSAYVSPTRGQQGNALQTLLAMAYALTGKPGVTIIKSRGVQHRIEFDIDPISREPRLSHQRVDIDQAAGTEIVLEMPTPAIDLVDLRNMAFDFTWCNPHVALYCRAIDGPSLAHQPTEPNWTKWKPTDPTSAHWYDVASLKVLIAAEINKARLSGSAQRTVSDFIGDFRGLAGTAKRRDICESLGASRQPLDAFFARGDGDLRRQLDLMKAESRPVKPRDLGVIGAAHVLAVVAGDPETSRYKRAEIDVDGVPYLIECGFNWFGAGARTMVTALNWSAAVGADPFRDLNGLGLESILTEQRAGKDEPVAFFLHVASPKLTFLDRGKSAVALPYDVNKAIAAAVRAVTDQWAKQRKAEERNAQARLRRDDALRASAKPMSIRDAAFGVMARAYAAASDNGKLPANARQIYYAARAEVLRLAQVDTVDSGRFTQELLIDFINDHPDECAEWNVVFSDRGHFVEPHTGRVVGLGTLAVRKYVGAYAKPLLIEGGFNDPQVSTHGPEGRFGALLYVEKEGFEPLLQQARIAERFDLAIMSCKGMSVTAARELVDQTCARFKVPLFVLHDFDIAGFSIASTLHQSNRRYQFSTVSGEDFKVVDLGLRLDDVEHMGLASEPVAFGKNGKAALRERLSINRATENEIDFLLDGHRVELNAMTSRQFIDHLEEKLIKHGVGKVVPTADRLAEAYRLFVRGKRARRAAEEILAARPAEAIAAPDDLEEQVRTCLKENPSIAWDHAIARLVDEQETEFQEWLDEVARGERDRGET